MHVSFSDMILMAINNFDVGCWRCWQDFMVSYVTARCVPDRQNCLFLEKDKCTYHIHFVSNDAYRIDVPLFGIYQVLSEDHLKLSPS